MKNALSFQNKDTFTLRFPGSQSPSDKSFLPNLMSQTFNVTDARIHSL